MVAIVQSRVNRIERGELNVPNLRIWSSKQAESRRLSATLELRSVLMPTFLFIQVTDSSASRPSRRAKSGVAAGRLFSLPALIAPILTLPHEKSAADLSALSWREGAENERDVNSRQPHFLLSEPLFS